MRFGAHYCRFGGDLSRIGMPHCRIPNFGKHGTRKRAPKPNARNSMTEIVTYGTAAILTEAKAAENILNHGGIMPPADGA